MIKTVRSWLSKTLMREMIKHFVMSESVISQKNVIQWNERDKDERK